MGGAEAVLTAIRTHARGSHRRTLVVDGDPWRSIPVEVLRDLDLREGDAVHLDGLSARIGEAAVPRARERALRLLTYRERSSHELESRLADDGYPHEVVRALVADLAASGLIDDSRFAHNYVRMLVVSRGYGRQRAMRELTARGIPEECAREALDAVAPQEDEEARASERARALARAGDTPERLASRLVRRGFAASVALRAARNELGERGESIDSEEAS